MGEQEKQIKNSETENTNLRRFHGYGNTYARQEMYVRSLGNKWAMENFKATRPYFSGD